MKLSRAASWLLFGCCWFGQISLESFVHAGMQQEAESSFILHSNIARNLEWQADQTLEKASQLSKNLGLRFICADYFSPTRAWINEDIDDSLFITGKTGEFRSVSYWFTFRMEDERLVSFYNPQIITLEDGKNAPLLDTPDKPSWTEERAIDLATKFRDIFIQPSGAILGNPRAKYIHSSYEVSKSSSGSPTTKSHVGDWTVSWSRTDSAGHPFYGDGVTISLSEEYGLSGAHIALFTPFIEKKDKILIQSDALVAARSHIAWISFWERYLSSFSKDPYETIVGDKLFSSGLIIVIPNHVASWSPFSSTEKPSGRLVWELWFKPIHKAAPSGPTYDDRFAVWVDAYSGEIVGGDAML